MHTWLIHKKVVCVERKGNFIMRVTESLIRQNKLNNQKKNRFHEDDEPTMCYREEKREYWAMNQNKSVFESKFQEGINTAESVFDKNAVFRTEKM